MECLRLWPEQIADIVQEASAGFWPLYSPGGLYLRIKQVTDRGLPTDELYAIKAAMAVVAAVKGKAAMTVANVHICGEGYAGKTMTRKALQKTLNVSEMGWVFLSSVLAPIYKRTRGMEREVLELNGGAMRVLIYDYGGQEEFHANHATHLASPNSVYLLVVPLWDMRPRPKPDDDKPVDKPMDLEEMVRTYTKWLKFINSVVQKSEHKAQCITVLNFSHKESQLEYSIDTITQRLSEVQTMFVTNCHSRISFMNPFVLVDSNIPASVHNYVTPVLKKAIQDLATIPVPIAPSVQAVLEEKDKWPLFCSEENLRKNMISCLGEDKVADGKIVRKKCIPTIEEVGSEATVDEVVKTIVEITQGLLEARHDIVVFPVSTGERVVITQPNWLTEQLLGTLFDPKKRRVEGGVSDHLLTLNEIAAAATSVQAVNQAEIDHSIFPKLLQHVGACIPVTLKDGDVLLEGSEKFNQQDVKHYFPAFCATSILTEHVHSIREAEQVVIRKICLLNPDLCIFPPGYFSSLFAEIVGKYKHSNLIRLFRDGMVLKFGDGNFQIIVRGDKSETSFTIEVEAKGSAHPAGSAWLAMQELRTLVLNTTSVRGNLAVEEIGVHPNAREGKAISIAVLEERLQKYKALSAEDQPFYYGINCPDAYSDLQKLAFRILNKLDAHHEEVIGKFDKIMPMLEQLRDISVEGLHALSEKMEDAAVKAEET